MRRLIYAPSTTILLPNVFGNGSDGDLVITSDYTMTSDMHWRNLTITNSARLFTAGYRVFCSGILLNLATISQRGNFAVNRIGGLNVGGNSPLGGTAGGDGLTAVGNGGNGGTNISVIDENHYYGGAGASVTGGSGGAGGSVTDVPNINAGYVGSLMDVFNGINMPDGTFRSYNGGTGGGGGGFGVGAVGYSGGGGGAGGCVFISAKYVNNTNGTIDVRGGNGGAASGTGNLGGGGGGGGGLIIINCLTYATGNTLYAGGAVGASVGSTTSPASAGMSGNLYVINSV